jgi:hypothetical protein
MQAGERVLWRRRVHCCNPLENPYNPRFRSIPAGS